MTTRLIFGFGLLLVFQSYYIRLSKAEKDTSINFPACDVFCHGELLDTIQMSHLFKDSKTFVDLKLKHLPNETIKNFKEFMRSKNDKPTIDDLKCFVNTNFEPSGKEFSKWTPNDWKNNPKFLNSIKNPSMKQWGKDLNRIWKTLGRKMIDDVHKNPDYYSIIPVSNGVIVPGGRFIEFYYWDSYWIIRGLLYSQMYETARGMLSNFLSMIKRFGFVPNGGRIYYAKRSQPPLLAAMIDSYVDFTNDTNFAIEAVGLLEDEFHFWKKNHTVFVNGHALAVYRDSSTGPRPESYREDVKNAEEFPTPELKQEFYSNIAAGAESGMDFSSRWFISKNGTNQGTLKDIKCRSIVPVELNAILYWNAKIIAKFHAMSNNEEKAIEYTLYAEEILEAIEAVLWNKKAGVWFDYDLINKKPRKYFVPTNLAPLWTNAFNIANSEIISKTVLDYLEKLGLNNHPGGVPNTLVHSGEQWDYPNVWPPMQYILVQGLENLKTTKASKLSKLWGHRWVKSNYEAYRNSNNSMFEKYDSEVFGGHGGGGEYDIQTGFGWTNGVIVEFLTKYGNDITPAQK
ncbi:trehalase-like [Episyrphus balteatus]|uniref:trehalase-like n=1 Tax=Episyrphus balteatus TaxID=286459 RepID=UPI0024857258|nr:trehalase-like [Episyrphus balteatus]XP_055856237.1 trehalase-like [Episyrphus balteatus]XP_055856238.1 trehalase-like [Episyrphus balteatus]XP_055856239.1 trehalase-like [Episyrphus balteatus]XP_055856241.1 trehalase-like [Episyrphus balteatus]XP_055856242.1 trehalase-like [Episyrphus balteatus]